MSSRVISSNSQISIGNTRVKGVTSKKIDLKREFEDLRELGSWGINNRTLTSNQTQEISFDFLLIKNGFNPFDYFFGQSDITQYPSTSISVIDNKEQIFSPECYLESLSLSFEARQIPRGSVTFQSSSFEITNGSNTSYSEDSEVDTKVFRPALTYVFPITNYDDTPKQCNDDGCSFCLQSFSIDVSAGLRPITLIGAKEPSVRVPTFPVVGQVSFSFLKNDSLDNIDWSPFFLEIGGFRFETSSIGGDQTLNITIGNCSLISVSEDLDIDGNETVSFNYDFLMTENNLIVQK